MQNENKFKFLLIIDLFIYYDNLRVWYYIDYDLCHLILYAKTNSYGSVVVIPIENSSPREATNHDFSKSTLHRFSHKSLLFEVTTLHSWTKRWIGLDNYTMILNTKDL